MSFLNAYFSHAQAVQRACEELGIDAHTDLRDFSLRLARGEQEESWRARFIARTGLRLVYTERLMKGTTGFVGWMPYPLRQWPLATSKPAFKQHAMAHGIATPAACLAASDIAGPFLIKQAESSFGEGIRGPFLAHDPQDPEQQLRAGEYYENFVVGLIAKAWCWGPECVALHLQPPDTVVGDGRASVRELVHALPNLLGHHDWSLVARLGACTGVSSLDTVLPRGKQVLVEYRYGSRYEQPSYENANALGRLAGTPLAQQFAHAAQTFAAAIPPQGEGEASLFTLDAIVDRSGEALFLEMNCHPLVHPDTYRAMIAGRFGAPTKKPAEAGFAALAAS